MPDGGIHSIGLPDSVALPGSYVHAAACLMSLTADKRSRQDLMAVLYLQGVGADVSPKGCLLMERVITSKETSDWAFDPSRDSLDNLREIQQGR